MTERKLLRIEKTLRNLPDEDLVTFREWLELLKTDKSRALYLLNEAELINARKKTASGRMD